MEPTTAAATHQQNIPEKLWGGFTHGLDQLQEGANQAYHALEPNLPESVKDNVEYMTRNPTRITGFLFLIGDLLMGAAGFFAKDKETGERKTYKMMSSAFGIANSYIWMRAGDIDPSKRVDRIIDKLDGPLSAIAVEENGLVGLGKSAPAQWFEQQAERVAYDPVSAGGNMNALGSVPMTISGVTRGNVGEFLNGVISIFNYGILNLSGRKIDRSAEGEDTALGGAKKLANKLSDLPSQLSGSIDYVTSGMGFIGGLQDFLQNRVPKGSGILQMMASSLYFIGGYYMTKMSGYQHDFLESQTITADKAEDSKALFDRTILSLQEKGKFSAIPSDKHDAMLDTLAATMAESPYIRLDAKDANGLRSSNRQENQELIRAGLQASYEAAHIHPAH